METREMICIGCPLGCNLSVQITDERIVVSGNNCPNGERYAISEVSNPTRIVTSTIKVIHGKGQRVSCKTSQAIPKDKIFACMAEIHKVSVEAPIKIGDVLIENICGTKANIVATKNIEKEGC